MVLVVVVVDTGCRRCESIRGSFASTQPCKHDTIVLQGGQLCRTACVRAHYNCAVPTRFRYPRRSISEYPMAPSVTTLSSGPDLRQYTSTPTYVRALLAAKAVVFVLGRIELLLQKRCISNTVSAMSTPRLERRQSVLAADPLGMTRTTVFSYPQCFSCNVCSLALGS